MSVIQVGSTLGVICLSLLHNLRVARTICLILVSICEFL